MTNPTDTDDKLGKLKSNETFSRSLRLSRLVVRPCAGLVIVSSQKDNKSKLYQHPTHCNTRPETRVSLPLRVL